MDDNAIEDRPLNRRASALLHRPNTHGPILVMKQTLIKTPDPMDREIDILCYEKVTEEELRSERFKLERGDWVEYRERRRQDIGNLFPGFTVLSLDPKE